MHTDILPLHSKEERYPYILLEYILGYTEKGYLDACKYCAGSLTNNPVKLVPGVQL